MTIVVAVPSPPHSDPAVHAVQETTGVRPTAKVDGLNVLVISADDATRRGIRNALPHQQVGRAGSLREAITALRSFAFDVVVSDATLGDGTAEDVYRELGSDEHLVILRGPKEPHAVRDFLARSNSVTLHKPFEVTNLRVAIRIIAERRFERRQA